METQNKYDKYVVSEEAPLLNWLLANLKLSRTKIKDILHGQGIRVNGKVVTKFDYPLQPGMKVTVSKSKRNNAFHSRYVKLVYEDQYIVVVEKNVGILSMAAGHSTLNVKTVLDDYFRSTKQHCQAHVVHRLDRDTSGLMIYAKDKQTELSLERDWHNTVFDRRYVAVLSGEMEHNEGTIENWLKDNRAFFTFSSPVDNGGKYAITHFYTHSADMNHPVCGDVKYGNGDDPLGRLCLHAYVLCFYHPVTHKPMEFETSIPQSFLSLF